MSVVTIRSADNMLLLDGQPFFAIQCRHLPEGGTWSAMSQTGFNCLRHRLFGAGDDRNGQTSGGQAALPSPEELGDLKVCVYLWDRMALSSDDNHHEELSVAVRQLKEYAGQLPDDDRIEFMKMCLSDLCRDPEQPPGREMNDALERLNHAANGPGLRPTLQRAPA